MRVLVLALFLSISACNVVPTPTTAGEVQAIFYSQVSTLVSAANSALISGLITKETHKSIYEKIQQGMTLAEAGEPVGFLIDEIKGMLP